MSLLLLAHIAAVHAQLLTAQQLPLRTAGRWIVDSAGNRVRLACVNWYGAHMELHVVGGLQVQPLQSIASRIAALGFNCVRLPFSVALVASDPPVRPAAIAANPQLVNKTAMEVLDATVASISAAGLLTVLNNHNTLPGWCCDLDSEEGLWATSAYNTSQWIGALAAVSHRYRSDPRVVAIDIRNEIHDAKPFGRVITWGTSDDIATDWKLATEAAGAAVYGADPKLLLVVSGMCFSYDLRRMWHDPPKLPGNQRLVWTVHYYSFGRWWTRFTERVPLSWPDIALASGLGVGLGLAALSVCLYRGRRTAQRFSARRDQMGACLLAFGCWLGYLTGGLHVGSLVARIGYEVAGCEIMDVEADFYDGAAVHTAWASVVSVALGALLWLLDGRRQRRQVVLGSDGGSPCGAPGTAGAMCPSPQLEQSKMGGEQSRVDPAEGLRCSTTGDTVHAPTEFVPETELQATATSKPPPSRPPHKWGSSRPRGSDRPRACHCYCYMNALLGWIMLSSGGTMLCYLSLKTETYDMLHDELANKWGLDAGVDVPVFVGEFGDGSGYREGRFWGNMLRFIKEYDLDWAYWPINGDVWSETNLRWDDEWYGILQPDYETVRRPGQLMMLQRVAKATR